MKDTINQSDLSGNKLIIDKRTVEQKKADILMQLRQCYGIITIACKRANVERTMCYEYLKDHVFKAAVDEINESYFSYVESRLFDLIRAGDKSAIIFYLKAKGKNKGYY
jgi:hypothetical protein